MSTDAAVGGAQRATKVVSLPPPDGDPSSIGFERVTVSYRGTVVLRDFSLTVEPGTIVAVIGPSGSGKTTALRAVAGFVRPVSGSIRIGTRDVTHLPPHARGIGMVVQNYALFPHMRVNENVAFGLRARRTSEEIVQTRIRECLAMVGMADYMQRYPRELSGGQQQRVAIARALAIRPEVLLLDEPLSALDAQIRRNMLDELARLHRELPSLTTLYVTHDQSEALTLADKIAVVNGGRLMAFGASDELYRRPPNRFVAEFLGRANLLPVRIEALDAPARFTRVQFRGTALLAQSNPNLSVGSDCFLCIRPHEIGVQPAPAPVNSISGTVRSVVWQGDVHNIGIEAEEVLLRLVCAPMRDPPLIGESLTVHFSAHDAILIPADRSGRD
jgi:2-aminoethylphosphonate transport system ATP-binding protein